MFTLTDIPSYTVQHKTSVLQVLLSVPKIENYIDVAKEAGCALEREITVWWQKL